MITPFFKFILPQPAVSADEPLNCALDFPRKHYLNNK